MWVCVKGIQPAWSGKYVFIFQGICGFLWACILCFFIGWNLHACVCVRGVCVNVFYEMITTLKLCVSVRVWVAVYKIVLSLLKCMCYDKAIVARDRHLATAQIVCVCVLVCVCVCVCVCVWERERAGEQSRESPALRPRAAAALPSAWTLAPRWTWLPNTHSHTKKASAHRQPVLLQPPSHPYTHTNTAK